MKTSARIKIAVAACLLLVATSSVAFAGTVNVAPEPTSIVVWAGLAGAGGMVYWWRNRRRS